MKIENPPTLIQDLDTIAALMQYGIKPQGYFFEGITMWAEAE